MRWSFVLQRRSGNGLGSSCVARGNDVETCVLGLRSCSLRPKVSSRLEASRLYTGYGMNLPPATYLAVCFKTTRAGLDEPVLERVQLRLEEDGVWRAIGFGSSGL